jgi:hypothetical protein
MLKIVGYRVATRRVPEFILFVSAKLFLGLQHFGH